MSNLKKMNKKFLEAFKASCLAFTLLTTIASFAAAQVDEKTSSAPFISTNTFRAHCDFTFDQFSRSIDPKQVKNGNLIYVKTDYLNQFFTLVHPNIQARYILLSHDSDYPIPGNFKKYLDDPKLIAWFGENVEGYSHPKLHPIPLGLIKRHLPWGDLDVVHRVMNLTPAPEREYLLYLNFRLDTCVEERCLLVKMFCDKSYTNFIPTTTRSYEEYLTDLRGSKFVLSPRGFGLDTHRTWESLLMGAIPIVRSSTLDPMFENLPVLVINEWSELTEEFLLDKYEKMKGKNYQTEKMYADYWLKLIDSYKNDKDNFETEVKL